MLSIVFPMFPAFPSGNIWTRVDWRLRGRGLTRRGCSPSPVPLVPQGDHNVGNRNLSIISTLFPKFPVFPCKSIMTHANPGRMTPCPGLHRSTVRVVIRPSAAGNVRSVPLPARPMRTSAGDRPGNVAMAAPGSGSAPPSLPGIPCASLAGSKVCAPRRQWLTMFGRTRATCACSGTSRTGSLSASRATTARRREKMAASVGDPGGDRLSRAMAWGPAAGSRAHKPENWGFRNWEFQHERPQAKAAGG